MRWQRRGLLLAVGGALTGSAVLAGCSQDAADPGVAVVGERPGGYLAGTQLDNIWELPEASLVDTSGTTTSLAGEAGVVSLVFFGYTHCPDVCTGILADLASAIQRVAPGNDDQGRPRVRVLFVTTDPARDTPAVVGEYLGRIDEQFVGLTGDLTTITTVAQTMGIAIEQGTRLPSGGYEIDHGTQVIGFGSNRRAQVLWSQGTSVANYKHDIGLLLDRQG